MKHLFILAIIIGISFGCNRKPPEQNKLIQEKNVSVATKDTLSIAPIKFLFNPVDSPITICGITAGYTKDSSVINMFGEGYYIKEIPHGGARVFYDSLKDITLISIIGVDRCIDKWNIFRSFLQHNRNRFWCACKNIKKGPFDKI